MLAISAHPKEKPHFVAFHLGLHCFPSYPSRGFYNAKDYYLINFIESFLQNSTDDFATCNLI